MEELQSKVMRQADELVEMHRKRGEVQTQLAELTTQLRKKDDDLFKKDERSECVYVYMMWLGAAVSVCA